MSELKKFYIGMGHTYDMLEHSLWYLSQLTLRGATEIDNFMLNKGKEFDHVQEFAGILERHQLRENHLLSSQFQFLYPCMWSVMRYSSDKELRFVPELALEMRLLRSELQDVAKLQPKKLAELRSLLLDFSEEFRYEIDRY